MFIPRTLSQTESTGRGAWARAAIVGGFLAVAIFAILSINVGTAQVNLSAGDVAQADITAPSTVSFVSDSQTAAAREAAASAVAPVYEQIAPPADIRDRQLVAYDKITRAVRNILLGGSATPQAATSTTLRTRLVRIPKEPSIRLMAHPRGAGACDRRECRRCWHRCRSTTGRSLPVQGATCWRRRFPA